MWPPAQNIPIAAKPRTSLSTPKRKASRELAKAGEHHRASTLEQLNKFVEGRLMGLSLRESALHAGVVTKSPKQLAKRAWQMGTDPYVRKLFAELREGIAREKLCTFAEQILDLKAIAFDQTLGVQGRMLAHTLLAKCMGHEAPSKVEAKVQAGVMLVPLVGDASAWEKMAMAHQAKLQEASKG